MVSGQKGGLDNEEIVWIAVILFTIVRCASNSEEDKAIMAVIHENINTIQKEDIPAYMATIHEQSPAYASTEETIKQIIGTYDLSYELKEAKIISKSANEARVSYIQTTKKINGPEFRDNEIKGVHILRKSDGKWKIYGSEIQNVEYLN